jgi:hypothetical protein
MLRCWAAMLCTLALVAGCSEKVGGQSQPTKLTPLPSPPSRSSSSTSVPPPAEPPRPGAPIGAVTAWIAAGDPVDVAGYHTANRDGTSVELGDDVAFTTPSGKTRCATMLSYTKALMCLVQLKNPPPEPPGLEMHWAGGWVDFDGQTLSVGSIHGDPGPFANGDGSQLPYGKTLKFGGYQCRTDQVGLYCTTDSQQSAARYSDAGIEPFGCLKSVPPPADIGIKFSC